MAQAVSRWPLTAKARVRLCGICGGLGQIFQRLLRFSHANVIPPLFHIRLSPVCDSSDQAAHYHHLGPKLRASFLTQHFGWKQNKKESKTLQRQIKG
jgi:hypothetical protein